MRKRKRKKRRRRLRRRLRRKLRTTTAMMTEAPGSDGGTRQPNHPHPHRISQKKNRSGDDTKAQRVVPAWYGGKCALTGSPCVVEGAHIVDVKATKRLLPDKNLIKLWNYLMMFWAAEVTPSCIIGGHENRNILPLRVDSHRLWDAHAFGLRPILHPTDPKHRLYLQMVWLKDI